MQDAIAFCLVTGVLSTAALDVWVNVVHKVTGVVPTNWGRVGRWLLGIPLGQWVLRGDSTSAPSGAEKALGWTFHYVTGVAYSALILLLWGTAFVHAPSIMPVFIVGVLISTLAGMMILMPGLGAGLMGRKLPNQGVMILYVIIAHAVYALGLYGAALLIA